MYASTPLVKALSRVCICACYEVFICAGYKVFTGHLFDKYSKTCRKRPLKKKTKSGFQDLLSLNAGQKYCRMLS